MERVVEGRRNSEPRNSSFQTCTESWHGDFRFCMGLCSDFGLKKIYVNTDIKRKVRIYPYH